MGFFSKLWKGVKKTFKKIFKPIKGLFKKVGKFMGKLGIAGQIALMFIPIPGMGFIMGKLGQRSPLQYDKSLLVLEHHRFHCHPVCQS